MVAAEPAGVGVVAGNEAQEGLLDAHLRLAAWALEDGRAARPSDPLACSHVYRPIHPRLTHQQLERLQSEDLGTYLKHALRNPSIIDRLSS